MSDTAVAACNVWKKFHRGEMHDSLRDLMPSLARRLTRRGPKPSDLSEGDFWALKEISFQVRRGEVLGIIGPNGAGKSTMLKILSRVLRPTIGQVQVNGRLGALIDVGAGFHPDLTGRENIHLNGSILGMKKREIDRRTDEIIEFSGVAAFIDTPVKRYSSGMQARLGFSIAAHLDPDVLLIDEVLSVGDAQFQRRCVEAMKNKLQLGTSVIFVSHNMTAVAALCSSALLLDHGQMAFMGDTQAACGRYVQLLSDNTVAHPDSAVTITHSSLTSPNGETIRPGDPIGLTVGLSFTKQVEHPLFSLVVQRVSDNLCLYDVAAQECGLPPRVYHQGEHVLIRFAARAHLLRGTYTIGFNVYLPSEDRHLIYANSLYHFSIQENGSYQGIVDIECRPSESRVEAAAGPQSLEAKG